MPMLVFMVVMVGIAVHRAVLVAQVDAEILHELVVDDCVRRRRGDMEEAHQVGVGGVVGAGQPDDVELFQAQLGLQGAQGVDLAAHADEGDALDQLRDHLQQQQLAHTLDSLRPTLLRIARLQLRNDTWAEDVVSETMIAAAVRSWKAASSTSARAR